VEVLLYKIQMAEWNLEGAGLELVSILSRPSSTGRASALGVPSRDLVPETNKAA